MSHLLLHNQQLGEEPTKKRSQSSPPTQKVLFLSLPQVPATFAPISATEIPGEGRRQLGLKHFRAEADEEGQQNLSTHYFTIQNAWARNLIKCPHLSF